MTGQIVTLPEGLRAKCTECLSPLEWTPDTIEDLPSDYAGDLCLMYADCCGHRYTMYPETMRLEREQD